MQPSRKLVLLLRVLKPVQKISLHTEYLIQINGSFICL